jgi:hypothetical protein
MLIKYIKSAQKRKVPHEIWICRYEKQFKDGKHSLKKIYINLSEWATGIKKWVKETEKEEYYKHMRGY